MYWNIVQSQRATSLQKRLAENVSAITTEPPLTSAAASAATPPTLWQSGRQSYMRSSARMSARPANQWLQATTRWWLTAAALGRPVVPEVKISSARSASVVARRSPSSSGAPLNADEREIDAARVVVAAVAPDFERQAGESLGAGLGERRRDDRRRARRRP